MSVKIIHHDKLVRDRIPEIVERSGREAVTEVYTEEELAGALDAKLMEEVREYQESRSPEELADILEVLHGIAFHTGLKWETVEDERKRKRDERGGFEEGIRLVEVRIPDPS